ncbi:MAG: DNA polymerase III subunit [Rubripirellula sp.]|nr:DNA polymerase III subunit [Rubripirellula sp.]
MSESTTKDWSDVIGHQQQRDWFAASLSQGRFSGSMLFVGSPGSGKRTVARLLAKTLLCETVPAKDMAPCGTCPSCTQVQAGNHPDLIHVSKPADKSSLPLEKLIGPPENRMQEGFCYDIQLKPMIGTRKVAILEDADFLEKEGANCLLKTLEEPPADTVIMLIGTVEQKQLPTIRSRCKIIRFSLGNENAKKLLRQVHQVEASDDELQNAIETSGGDMHVAQRLLDSEANQFRDALINQLNAEHPDPIKISQLLTKHCDQAGKEARKRRHALRDAVAIALQFFRRKARDAAYSEQFESLTMARLDRSVRAVRELERNANQATLIDCFAADIAAGITGDRGGIG